MDGIKTFFLLESVAPKITNSKSAVSHASMNIPRYESISGCTVVAESESRNCLGVTLKKGKIGLVEMGANCVEWDNYIIYNIMRNL